jgi:hypothetical protein
MDLKISVNQRNFGYGIRRIFSLRLSPLLLSYMVLKFGVVLSLKNHGER